MTDTNDKVVETTEEIVELPRYKIAVFGDSYADTYMNPLFLHEDKGRSDESWLNILSQIGGHKITSYGLSGTSTWYSFQKFLGEYQHFDFIIFSYSSMQRIHSMPDPLYSYASYTDANQIYESTRYKQLTTQDELRLCRILAGAVEISQDSVLNRFVQQHVFNEINNLCKENNIPLINILPFDNRATGCINLNERSGPVGKFIINLIKRITVGFSDTRYCHLSFENNQILAEIIQEQMQEMSEKNVINLVNTKRFIFNNDITQRYMNYRKI